MKSTINLFKALPIKAEGKKAISEKLLSETFRRGFIFSPEVLFNYSESELFNLIDGLGLNPEQINNSFHKSWEKIKTASIEQLVIEQIVHYITTYGFEELGHYDKDSVYIPLEKLEIPEIDINNIKLIVINGYTKEELKEKLLNLLQSGIALKEDTINDIVDVATFVELNESEIETIKNKEVKTALYDYLNFVPENPTEFLRYIVYKSTDKTLLIKDKNTIETIKYKKNLDVLGLLVRYKNKHGLKRLAEIFYRFKPIFLAFRTNSQLKATINKIRKLAVKNHKPMPEDYLNSITDKIKKGETIDQKRFYKELSKVNIFRKIRLAYALNYRANDPNSIIYKIRNGKGYATEFEFKNTIRATEILNVVVDSIEKDISKNVKGKKIYIPEYVEYALPATEKQFTGNFPSGTCITIPNDMIFGVHWENVNNRRIDLDLSLISPTTGKIGWDSSYRTEDRSILFSGDMTDAHKPDGASELFYVKKQENEAAILLVNYYNYNKEIEVPFEIIVAKEKANDFGMNYMVNPNNVLSIAKSKINKRQNILGLLVTTDTECKFYFAETSIGKSITSSGSAFVEHSRKYLFNFYKDMIILNYILEEAGAELVSDKENCDIDLSPETLEKDSIINLLI